MVPPFYDSLLAKLIAHGADRAEAFAAWLAALEDAPLFGLAGNLCRFLRDLLRDDHAFRRRLCWDTTLYRRAGRGIGYELLQRPEAFDAAAGLGGRRRLRSRRPAPKPRRCARRESLASRQFSLELPGGR